MSVRTQPGSTAFTSTPCLRYVSARIRVSAFNAVLDIEPLADGLLGKIAQAAAGTLHRIGITAREHDSVSGGQKLASGLEPHPAIGAGNHGDATVRHSVRFRKPSAASTATDTCAG